MWLFSYGTLRQAEVQRAVFGRELAGVDDMLVGFEQRMVIIDDPAVVATSGSDRHPVLWRTEDGQGRIPGMALPVDEADLRAADAYETDAYRRIGVTLASGRAAFVYVAKESVAPIACRDEVTIVDPDPTLLQRLLPVARRIFTATFARHYDAAAFGDYCDGVYGPGGRMAQQFARPEVQWRVAVAAGEPIGYAKLAPLNAPVADPPPGALELEQLYVLPDWHGRGVADALMRWALDTAGERGAPAVYLTVFDHNHRAKRFYARYGFEEVGRCTFQLGDRVDDDRIWRRLLPST